MHIAVEFLQQVEVSLSQTFLVFQRHHLPVGFVGRIDGTLTTGLKGILLQVFVDVGHLVHRHDGTSHEYGLHQSDGADEEVTGIGIESIDHRLSEGIEFRLEIAQSLGRDVVQGSHVDTQRTQQHTHFLHRQLSHRIVDTPLQVHRRRRSYLRKCGFLMIVKQRYRTTGILVGTQCTDVRQVFGSHGLADVRSHVLLHLRDTHLLVVAQCHRPTAVECQQPLRLDGHRRARKQN